MIEEPPILPVYIVTGANFIVEIALDEYNARFSKEDQILEAATRAIEVCKQMREDAHIVMNPESRDEKPFLGTTVLVHLKDTNPDAAAVVLTHICMGNTGLYKDAMVMEAELNKQIEIMQKREAQREAENKIREEKMKLIRQINQEPPVIENPKSRKKKI